MIDAQLSPRTNAALMRLRHASDHALDDVLKEILEGGEGLVQAVAIVERRIDGGDYVVTQRLSALIAATRSHSLYARVRKQLFADDWALVELYRSGYPDADIEERLCERLYQTSADAAEPRRRYIAEAMRGVGTAAALPTLEAILFDGKPTAQVKQILADAALKAEPGGTQVPSKSWLLGAEASSRKTFLEAVALAIDAIRSRSASADDSSAATPEDPSVAADIDNAELRRVQASRFSSSPLIAVIMLRMGAEALCKDAYRLLGRETGGKPAKKMTMEDLLTQLKNSEVPDVFKIAMQSMQSFGNFAAHDQDDEHKYLTVEIASALQVLYEQAKAIYVEWSGPLRATGGSPPVAL
jgi:hypothetical protein